MQAPSTDTEQLRLARERIAALEQELAALRSQTPTPTPTPITPTPTTPTTTRTSTILHRPTPLLKPRPVIMTRRAAAAAAAAKAAVSAVVADLTRNIPKTPITVQPRQLESSALSESRKSASATPVPILSPSSSEVSGHESELSSSALAVMEHHSSPCPETPCPETTQPSANSCKSSPRMDSRKDLPSIEPAPVVLQASAPIIEAVTPELPRPTSPSEKSSSQDDRHFLSTSLPTDSKSSSPKPQAPAPASAPSSEKSKTETAPSQKRRPPPLPVVKTASTKKERHNIIAKCTEPRPGQTRYWTEEEHEHFLEAVAEYGEKAYVAISNYVETRTPKQVRTHAQKFQMKMARLAKQSIEAGEPIQMPAGMNPVVQVPTVDGKSTLVPLPSDGHNTEVLVKLGNEIPGHVPVIVAQPPSKGDTKKRTTKKSTSGDKKEKKEKPVDALVKISSTVSDEMSDESVSAQTDPYMDYIGGASDSKVEMDLEHTFAAKLCQTLKSAGSDIDSGEGEFLMSDGASNDSRSVDKDDEDLEDLDKLEDGDFSLAAFSNPTDNWLLPDVPV